MRWSREFPRASPGGCVNAGNVCLRMLSSTGARRSRVRFARRQIVSARAIACAQPTWRDLRSYAVSQADGDEAGAERGEISAHGATSPHSDGGAGSPQNARGLYEGASYLHGCARGETTARIRGI